MFIAAFLTNFYNLIKSSFTAPSSTRPYLLKSKQTLSQIQNQGQTSLHRTSRTALLLILVCSACKPLLTTDSSPANPELNLQQNAEQNSVKIALAPVYRQAKIAIAPPVGWKPVKVAGIKYAVFSQDSSTSISILEQNFVGSLPAFVQTNLQAMAIAFSNWQQLSEAEFQTDKGMLGKMVATQSQQLNLLLYQRFYFFMPQPRSDRHLIVVCTGKPEATATLIATCDASLKTLVVSP